MKERNYDVVKTVIGILLAAIGFVLLRRYADSQGVMAVLPLRLHWRGLRCLWPRHGRDAEPEGIERLPRPAEAVGN